MRFRDAFLLGVLIGLAYAAVRYPGTLGCVVLATVLVVAVLVIVYWDWISIGVLAAAIAYLVARRRSRA